MWSTHSPRFPILSEQEWKALCLGLLLLLPGCSFTRIKPDCSAYCDRYLPNLQLSNACLFGMLYERSYCQ